MSQELIEKKKQEAETLQGSAQRRAQQGALPETRTAADILLNLWQADFTRQQLQEQGREEVFNPEQKKLNEASAARMAATEAPQQPSALDVFQAPTQKELPPGLTSESI